MGDPVDSILEAVFTVSPKRQNLGIFRPTTPAHTGPLKANLEGRVNFTTLAHLAIHFVNIPVDSCPKLNGLVRPVPNLELLYFLEQCERHGGDFARVAVPVPLGQPAHHHVGVANRLHLVRLKGPEGNRNIGESQGDTFWRV